MINDVDVVDAGHPVKALSLVEGIHSSGSDSDSDPRKPATDQDESDRDSSDSQEDESDDVPDIADAAVRRVRDRALKGLHGAAFDRSGQRVGSQISSSRIGGDNIAAGKDVYVTTHYHSASASASVSGTVAGPILEEEIDRLIRLYVPPSDGADAEFEAALRRPFSPLVMLAGVRSTGRRHRALAVLGRVTSSADAGPKASSLPVRYLGAETKLTTFLTAGAVGEARGYVLDATGMAWARDTDPALLAQVTEKLCRTDSRTGSADPTPLVILVDDDVMSPVAEVIRHSPPNARAVLTRHLAWSLAVSTEKANDIVRQAKQHFPDVAETIDQMYQPWSAVAVASALDTWWCALPKDERATPQVYARQRDEALQRARLMLRGVCDEEATTRAQAFILAAATLDGATISRVVEGSHGLARKLRAAHEGEAPAVRSLFDAPLARWLHHVGVRSPEAADSSLLRPVPAAEPRTGSAVVRLHEPTMAGVILEVAWNEFDQARDPILEWLSDLCFSPDDSSSDAEVQTLAALAIGKIATLDFDFVKEKLLTPWSKKRKRGQVLASILESVVAGGTLDQHVLDLLKEWAQGQAPKNVIAIRAYGTRIGGLYPEEAFAGIKRAFRGNPMLGRPVDTALTGIYLAGCHTEVLEQLVEWSATRGRYRSRAAVCLIKLAGLNCLSDQHHAATLPDLAWHIHDPGLLDAIARLWSIAVEEPEIRRDAWDRLGQWQAIGRTEETVAQISDAVLTRIRLKPGMRERLRFHERRWQLLANKEHGNHLSTPMGLEDAR